MTRRTASSYLYCVIRCYYYLYAAILFCGTFPNGVLGHEIVREDVIGAKLQEGYDYQGDSSLRATPTTAPTKNAATSSSSTSSAAAAAAPAAAGNVNPFQSGCLYTRLSSPSSDDNNDTTASWLSEENRTRLREIIPASLWETPRVCNSDDNNNAQDDLAKKGGTKRSDVCFLSELEALYPELRVHHQDIHTATIMSWIYQVLLMEVVRVPATVGLTTNTTLRNSFYTPLMEYGSITPPSNRVAYPYEGLREAHTIQPRDCTQTEKPCTHIIPEVWPGEVVVSTDYHQLVEDDMVEPASESGVVGQSGLHIPLRTLKEYPQLGSWVGLQGHHRRELLASLFGRPTTWKVYCEEVSLTNCTPTATPSTTMMDDNGRIITNTSAPTATRYPASLQEENAYYHEGSFKGHFRWTPDQNCTIYPDTCTGHVVTPPCDAPAHLDQQLFWNDIVGLSSSPGGGVTTSTMYEIWNAAHATQAHVMSYHRTPDLMAVAYLELDDAESSFIPVRFPPTTRLCHAHRATLEEKCSNDTLTTTTTNNSTTTQQPVSAGDPEGACGSDIEAFLRIVSTTIRNHHYNTPQAERSPAYDFLKNLRIRYGTVWL